jgi:hypothetical protein
MQRAAKADAACCVGLFSVLHRAMQHIASAGRAIGSMNFVKKRWQKYKKKADFASISGKMFNFANEIEKNKVLTNTINK